MPQQHMLPHPQPVTDSRRSPFVHACIDAPEEKFTLFCTWGVMLGQAVNAVVSVQGNSTQS